MKIIIILKKNLVCTSVHVHTYIHNWSLQHFSQDYDLASHTIQNVRLNFKREMRNMRFKVDAKRQIFEKLFLARFILSEFLPERGNRRENIFFFFHISF